MPLRPVRLLPTTGLDLTYIDDRSLPQGAVRGMTNFRVVDGELWMREGEEAKRRDLFGNAWNHAVSLDLQYGNVSVRRHFLISQWGVLEVDLDTWSISVPYTHEYQADLVIPIGDTTGTVWNNPSNTTKLGLCNLLIAPDSDGNDTAYQIISVEGTGAIGSTFTLDRPFTGTSAALVGAKFYATFGKPSRQNRRDNHRCSWTVFRQGVTRAQGTVWTGTVTSPWNAEKSPAVTAGGIYLIVCPGIAPSNIGSTATPKGPFAIRLDATEGIKADIMRQTKDSMTAATAFNTNSIPSYCETWMNRLFVVREDENNANGDRCIWFSADGDMLTWHNGTIGVNAVHARERFGEGHDRITGLNILGDNLIVHRARSQNILSKTGSAATPFRLVRNDQGLGFVSAHSIQNVRGVHYGWTEYGPATFDGQRIQLLPKSILRIASMMRSTSEWSVSDGGYPESIASAYHAPRQQIWWLIAGGSDYWEKQFNAGFDTQIMVLDLQTGAAWRYTYQDGYSLGVLRDTTTGKEFVVRSRQGGTLVQATQTNKAKDDSRFANETQDQETPCYVEFPWNELGSAYRKSVHKIEIELRGWSTDPADSDDAITDVNPSLFAADTTVNYKLSVHTDHNMAKLALDEIIRVPNQTYIDAKTVTEGTRLPATALVIPKSYAHGNVFKLRLSNGVPQRRPLRLSQITLWVQDQESDDAPTRRERVS